MFYMSKKYIGMSEGTYSAGIYGDKRFEIMKENGYDFCDMGLSEDRHPIYNCVDSEIESVIAGERDAALKAGIKISQVHGPWRYPPQDFTEEDRAERLEKMQICIRATKLLGCKNMVVHPIMPFGVKENPDPEFTFKTNVEFFKKLLVTAEENEVNVCIENVPFEGFNLSTPSQVLGLIKELDSPYAKACLDTGHCAVMGVKPGDAVRELGDKIAAMHLHDNNGMHDEHRFIFHGVIDWEVFAAALKETDLDCVFSPECAPGRNLEFKAHSVLIKGLALASQQLAKMAE